MTLPKDAPHPLQPIIDVDGLPRFKQNKIVRYLLNEGPFDLIHLSGKDFSDEDEAQFAQLIGYSVRGFCELSYVDEEVKDQVWDYVNTETKDTEETDTASDTCLAIKQ